MNFIYSVRDTLKKLYTDYDLLMKPVLRFLVTFVFLAVLRNYVGFNDTVCNPVVLLGMSAVCALFPAGCITFVCTCFVLGNMYSVSYSLFLLGAVLAILTVMLYFGFRPGKGIYIILIPIGFLLKIPYAIPVILGLCGGLSAAVPVSIGVLFWFILRYFHVYADTLTSTTDVTAIITEFVSITKELFMNREFYIVLIAFIIGIGIVYFLSRLSFNHSWTVAVCSGLAAVSIICIGGAYMNDSLDIASELIRVLISLPAVLIYEVLFYSVDYRSTEHLQFEDDEYYYYVKAVPKITMDHESSRKE